MGLGCQPLQTFVSSKKLHDAPECDIAKESLGALVGEINGKGTYALLR